MAGNIKGITIEIGGDTTKLDKALSNVDKSSQSVNKELKQVNSLLKFNPGNADVVAQKQQLLAKQIENTSSRLKTLKDAQAQVEAQFKSGDLGEEEYRAFQREVVATEGKLKNYQGQLTASKSEQAALESSTKQLSSYFAASGKDVSDFADILGPKLTGAINEGKASSAQLNEAINKIGRTVTQNEGDFDKFKSALKGIDDGGAIDGLKSELQQLSTESDSTADALGGISKKLDTGNLMEAGEALEGIGDKAGELVGDTVEAANSLGDFEANAQRSFGMSGQAAEQLGGVVKDVMANGIAPDVETAGEAVMNAKNYFGDLNNVDLTNVSNKMVGLQKTFGVDFADSAKQAKKLMDNFGVSGNQAFDILTAGFQQGLNNSDDFLDTIDEYSPLMKAAGLSATDFTNILASGMKNGAMNTDKVADAVKEFQLRLGDGTFEGNIKSFSKGTQDLFGEWKKGKATTKEVMASVSKDLASMDPAKQQAALSLLGTQFEDLGPKASIATLAASDGLKKVGGAADSLSKKSPGEKMAASFAQLKLSLEPIITAIIQFGAKAADAFNGLSPEVKKVIAVIAGIAGAIAVIAPVVTSVIGAVSAIGGVISAVIGFIAPIITGIGAAIAALNPITIAVGAVIAAVVGAAILVWKNFGAIVDWLKGIWSGITGFFTTLWSGITTVFTNGVNAVVTFLTPAFTAVVSTIKTIWSGVSTFFSTIWNAIKTIFTVVITAIAVIIGTEIQVWKTIITTVMNAIKTVISTVWNAIKAFFGPILNAIKTAISTAWNAIKTVTTTVFNAVKSVITSVWNGIKSFFGLIVNAIKTTITNAWNGIKSVTSSVFNAVKSVVSTVWNAIKGVITPIVNAIKTTITTVWNAIKSTISTVLNAIKSVVSRVWNGIKSTTSSVFNAIKSVASSVWNGIKSTVSGVVNGIKSAVSGAWNAIKSVTSSVWGGIKSAISGPINAARDLVRRAIDAIKGFFHFSISWPHIPMPSFGISPRGWKIGDLLKGSIPHLAVSWHAAGGIMTKPTMFAANGSMAHIGGEAGAEGVIPLRKDVLAQIGAGIAAASGGIGGPTINVEAIYGAMTPAIARKWATQLGIALNDVQSRNLANGGGI